jgi:hypothetical protein
MSYVALGVTLVGAGSAIYSSNKASKASGQAADAQSASNAAAMAQQSAQFAEIQKLLAPYIQAGSPGLTSPYIQGGNAALQQMQNLAGLGGSYQQQQAIGKAQQDAFGKVQQLQDQRNQQLADIQKGFLSLEQQAQQAQQSTQKKRGFLGRMMSGDLLGIKELQSPGMKFLQEQVQSPLLKTIYPDGKIDHVPSKEEQQKIIDAFNADTEKQVSSIGKTFSDQAQAIQKDRQYAGLNQQYQQQAIQGIEQGPLYQALAQQGENAMLQNASATGGVRGGNIQGALAQYRPNLLNSLIEQQYAKLAGLTSLGANASQNLLNIGQASAAGVGAAGQSSASAMGNLMVGQGQAQAAGIIGQANAQAQGTMGVANAVQGGFQNYQLMQALNNNGSLFGGGGSTAFASSGSPGYMTPSNTSGGGWTAQQSADLAYQ